MRSFCEPRHDPLTLLAQCLPEAAGGGAEESSDARPATHPGREEESRELVGTEVEVGAVPGAQRVEHRTQACRPGGTRGEETEVEKE